MIDIELEAQKLVQYFFDGISAEDASAKFVKKYPNMTPAEAHDVLDRVAQIGLATILTKIEEEDNGTKESNTSA